jgi:hypothetical protein
MASIMLISTPSGGLTYDDGDVVSVLDSGLNPGNAVVANPTDSWSFVYVEDKEPSDPELTDLLVADVSSVGVGDEQVDEILHKRRYFLTLPGDTSSYTTYSTYSEAPAVMKMSWSEVSGYVNDKQG